MWPGSTVGALVVVNAVGDVFTLDGRPLTGGSPIPPLVPATPSPPLEQTVLICVATDALCSRTDLMHVAVRAHDALGACLRPAHTRHDGDIAFAVSCGDGTADPDAARRGRIHRRRSCDRACGHACNVDRRCRIGIGGDMTIGSRRPCERTGSTRAGGAYVCAVRTRRRQDPGGVRCRGSADADLMIVGEAPGRHEDEQGSSFRRPVGSSSSSQLLGEIGLAPIRRSTSPTS